MCPSPLPLATADHYGANLMFNRSYTFLPNTEHRSMAPYGTNLSGVNLSTSVCAYTYPPVAAPSWVVDLGAENTIVTRVVIEYPPKSVTGSECWD